MTGKYYLGQVVNPAGFQSGCINLIRAPVGCGKTHFALKTLPSHAIGKDFVLYITDTNMNREQILATYKDACGYDKDWRKFLNSQPKMRLGKGWGDWGNIIDSNSKVTIMNYAQVAALIKYGHAFDWSQFDYAVCDELHNLIHYNNIDGSILQHSIDKIQDTLFNHPQVKIIGMTATPNKVFQKFPNVVDVLEAQQINVDDLYHYEIHNRWNYRDYMKTLYAIPQGKKGILYFDRIDTIKKAEAVLIERGHKTASFWSVRSPKQMTQQQMDVRQHIIDHQLIPPNVDILLINASCQTGVNIKNDDITFMVIHAADGSDTLVQARGRLRNDLNNLHYYDKNAIDTPNPVPADYLNRKITVAEMREVCAEVRYMKPRSNDYYKTKKVIEYLEQNGYTVESTRIGHGGKTRGYIIKQL